MRRLFFSHAWAYDEEGRDTHARCRALAHAMGALGWTVWLDEERIVGRIDACMTAGIDEADAVVVCITKAYAHKIDRASRSSHARDACLCEWTYMHARRKTVVPVVFEPCMRGAQDWPGVLALHLGNTLYVDAAADDPRAAARALHAYLRAQSRVLTPRSPLKRLVTHVRPPTRAAPVLLRRGVRSPIRVLQMPRRSSYRVAPEEEEEERSRRLPSLSSSTHTSHATHATHATHTTYTTRLRAYVVARIRGGRVRARKP